MNKLNCLIIGAGNIGALKSIETPTFPYPLTHAHAIKKFKELNLICIVDNDIAKAKEAGEKWGCNYCQSLDEVRERIDIVIVAVPSSKHHEVLMSVLDLNPRLIVCEKPFTDNLIKCEIIINKYKKVAIPLVVNYNRRYLPEIRQKVKEIQSQEIQLITAQYCRGWLNDGVHMLDMISWLCGEIELAEITAIEHICEIDKDPSYNVAMVFEKCPNVSLNSIDSRKYKVFQMQVYTDKGAYYFQDFFKSIYEFKIYESEWGVGGLYYPSSSGAIPVDLPYHLVYLYENIIKFFKGEENLICTAEDGLKVHNIIDMCKLSVGDS